MFECTSRRICAAAGDGDVEAKQVAPSLPSFEIKRELDGLRRRLDTFSHDTEDTLQQHAKMMSTLKAEFEAMRLHIESNRQGAQAQRQTSNGNETKEAALPSTLTTKELELLKSQSQRLQEEQERQKEMLRDMAASLALRSSNVQVADADTNGKSASIVEPSAVASGVSPEAQGRQKDQIDSLQREVVDIHKHVKDLETSMREEYDHLRNNTCSAERAKELADILEEARVTGQVGLTPNLAKSPTVPELQESEEEVVATDSAMIENATAEGIRDLEHTVWEVAILIGLRSLGWAPTILAALCVAFNAGAQLLFCQLVQDTLTSREMPTSDFLEYWRAQAHDISNMDPVTGMSLVSRVCEEDATLSVAGSQTTLIGNALAYNGALEGWMPSNFRTGPTLFSLAWLMWFMCTVKEVVATFEFMYALLAVPRGRTQLLITKEGFAIHKMSLCSLLQNSGLQFGRLYVCMFLFWSGSLWLANEMDLTNLVLNAAALSFITDLDEMIYDIAMPTVVQCIACNLEPLRLPKYKNRCLEWVSFNLGLRPFFFAIALVGAYIYFYVKHIEQNVFDLQAAYDAVCIGKKDWVYYFSNKNYILMAKRTPQFTEDFAVNPRTSQQQTIQTGAKQMWMRSSDDPDPTWLAWLTPNPEVFNEFASKTIFELNQVVGIVRATCESADNFSEYEAGFVRSSLKRLSGVENATGCLSLVHACGLATSDWLRVQCPLHCGCGSPLSGLYFGGVSRGCARQCLESWQYSDIVNKLACSDVQPEPYFREMWLTGWKRFWNDFAIAQDGGGFWNNPGAVVQQAEVMECNILKDPYMRFTFCFESEDITPLTKFCPVACGCLELPTLPGCPPTCKIYDHQFRWALAHVPCNNTEAGFLATQLYRDLLEQLVKRYEGSWKATQYTEVSTTLASMNLTSASADAMPTRAIIELLDRLGCQGVVDLFAPYPGVFSWVCSVELLGISAFCPEMCGCRTSPTTMCPDNCVLAQSR